MNPYAPSHDPNWHRLVDGLVILVIGMAVGLVVANLFASYETVEIRSTKFIRKMPAAEGAGNVQAPEQAVRFEEI